MSVVNLAIVWVFVRLCLSTDPVKQLILSGFPDWVDALVYWDAYYQFVILSDTDRLSVQFVCRNSRLEVVRLPATDIDTGNKRPVFDFCIYNYCICKMVNVWLYCLAAEGVQRAERQDYKWVLYPCSC